MSRKLLSHIRQVVRAFVGRDDLTEPLEVERSEWRFYLDYLRPGMVVYGVQAERRPDDVTEPHSYNLHRRL